MSEEKKFSLPMAHQEVARMNPYPPKSRPVAFCPKFYRADIWGNIWTCRIKYSGGIKNQKGTWKKMIPIPTKSGHRQINFRVRGETIKKSVHRTVLEAFVPCPDPALDCLHGDDNPSNNELTNLRWGTHQENMLDKVLRGRSCRGENRPSAKLKEYEVAWVRWCLVFKYTVSWIAQQLGISRAPITAIKFGRRWKHV